MATKEKFIGIRLPVELWRNLREEAKVLNLTVSELVRQKFTSVVMPPDAPSEVQIVRRGGKDVVQVRFPITPGLRRTIRMVEKRGRGRVAKRTRPKVSDG